MKKVTLFIMVLIIGVIGILGYVNFLNSNSLEMPKGWTFNKNESEKALLHETFKWDYNSELVVSITTWGKDTITSGSNLFPKGTTETKNITIEGINVRYEKSQISGINGVYDSYYFQKNSKKCEVDFLTYSENKTINLTKNPYRAQIDEAIKSIIKTI